MAPRRATAGALVRAARAAQVVPRALAGIHERSRNRVAGAAAIPGASGAGTMARSANTRGRGRRATGAAHGGAWGGRGRAPEGDGGSMGPARQCRALCGAAEPDLVRCDGRRARYERGRAGRVAVRACLRYGDSAPPALALRGGRLVAFAAAVLGGVPLCRAPMMWFHDGVHSGALDSVEA